MFTLYPIFIGNVKDVHPKTSYFLYNTKVLRLLRFFTRYISVLTLVGINWIYRLVLNSAIKIEKYSA